MTFFRYHDSWAGIVLLCLSICLLVTRTFGAKSVPWLCDRRFGERCLPNSELFSCNNVLIKEWSYCNEFDHFCCKDWPIDDIYTHKPDRATLMLFKDNFKDNSVFG